MTLSGSDALTRYRQRMFHETEFVCLSGIPHTSDPASAPTSITVALNRFFGRIQLLQEQPRNTEKQFDDSVFEGHIQDSLLGDVLNTLSWSGEAFYRQGEIYREIERPEPTDPVSALHTYHRLIILGAPGSGKSTLLQYLACEAASNAEGPVPILLPLRFYADTTTTPLRTFALDYAAGCDSELRESLEHAEQILWLLDDVETGSAGWDSVVSQIASLEGDMVMTARPRGYQSAGLETVAHFEMLPMNAGEVDNFLDECFIALSECRSAHWDWAEEQTIRLKHQREQKSQISPFISNPLLLTFLCVFSESEHLQAFPDQRSELYGRCLESLLDFWGHYSNETSPRQVKSAFRPGDIPQENARLIVLNSAYFLGWYVHTCYYEASLGAVPVKKAVIEALGHYLETIQTVNSSDWGRVAKEIVEFWLQTGMLVELDSADRESHIMFRHPLFREYAAACRIYEMFQKDFRSAWRYIFPRLHHYAWQEPLLLAGTMLSEEQSSKVISRLLRKAHPYERSIHRNLALAAMLLREGTACSDLFRNNILQKLGSLSHEYRQQRLVISRITFLLGLLGIPTLLVLFSSFPYWGIGLVTLLWGLAWHAAFVEAVAPGLQALLAIPTRIWNYLPDRKLVVQLLAQRQTSEVVPYLVQAVADSQPDVRRSAVETLGKIGDTRSIPNLVSAMNDLQGNIRKIAAFAIQKIGDLPVLVQALNSDQEGVRHAAAEALEQSEGDTIFAELVQKLDAEEVYARRLVVDILKQIGGDQTIPLLVQAVDDSDKKVRQTAIEALGQLGTEENPYSRVRITSHLVKGLDDSEPAVQQAAAYALGQIRDPDTIPALMQALRKSKTYVTRGISDALRQVVTQRSSSYLIKFLKDDNANIRKTAAMALGQINNSAPEIISALIEGLHDFDKNVRREAAEALGNLDSSQAISPLIEALQDPEWGVRWIAAEALGKLGSPDAIAPLLKLVNDSNRYVCRAAIEALGKSGETAIIPFLIQELKSGNPTIRKAAKEALDEIGEAQTVPFLLQAAKYEEEEHIRQDAEDALRQIGDVRAIPYLLDALQDEEVRIRRIAVEVLGRIRSMKAVTPLMTVLHDTDGKLRSLAAVVLGKLEASEAVPTLRKLLQDQNSMVRRSAARSLGRIWDPEAVPALVGLLHDADLGVRQAVVEALGRIGDPEAVPALIETLQQTDWRERWSIAYALGRIRDIRAIPVLVECLGSGNDINIRRSSAEALGQIGHPQPVPELIRLLTDESWFVRWAAVHALGRIGDPSAVDDLIGILRDSHEKVRWAAAEALGNIGDAESAPALIQALNDADWDVCKAASRSLELISRAETIPHLIRAMQQRNNYVRRAAAFALSQIQDEEAIPYLIQALQSHSQYIRQVATHNLIRLRSSEVILHLLPLVKHRDVAVRTCAAQIIGRLAHVIQDRRHLKKTARALWWRLTDHDSVAKAVFYALVRVVNRLSVIEVEQRYARTTNN